MLKLVVRLAAYLSAAIAVAGVGAIAEDPKAKSKAESHKLEEKFDEMGEPKWQAVGLPESDYRLREGALEVRVLAGVDHDDPPRIEFPYSFHTEQTLIAEVRVTLLQPFAAEGEFVGLAALDGKNPEFVGKKEWKEDKLVFSPGYYEFIGKSEEEEGDPTKYREKSYPAEDGAGKLRIIVRQGYAHFQVGPNAEGKYLNLFESRIVDGKLSGFCLYAQGAPKDAEHWVRFDDFRILP